MTSLLNCGLEEFMVCSQCEISFRKVGQLSGGCGEDEDKNKKGKTKSNNEKMKVNEKCKFIFIFKIILAVLNAN